MTHRQFKSLLWSAGSLGLAAALLAGPVQAQSAWSRLSQIISPANTTEKAQQSVNAAQAQSAENAGVAQVGDEPPQGQQFAALAPDSKAIHMDLTSQNGVKFYGEGEKQLDLGLESEDGAKLAVDLFKDPEIQRLMGDKPRFRYNAAGKQDPMLVPWVRNAAIFQELNKKADDLVKAGDLDKAAAVYQKILDIRDPRFQAPTMAKLQSLMDMKNERAKAVLAAETGAAVEVPVELPAWITDNTTAVLISSNQQLCMVGEHMLAVGDSVPNYPEVRIMSIGDDKVMYQIQDKSFEVPLISR